MKNVVVFPKKEISSPVCVIVLTHNRLDVTKEFLSSFLLNTFNKYDLVIVDNMSTDRTRIFLEYFKYEYNDVHLIFLDHNSGVIEGRNEGYERVKEFHHDYLIFLDNDQIVQEGWLSQHINVLNSGYDLVGVDAWTMNDNFRPIRSISNPDETFSYVGCGGMIIKREVIEEVGLFDPIFSPMYFEDPDFNFKCHNAGFKIGWNYKAKINHLAHQTMEIISQQERRKNFKQNLEKFRNKWKGYKPLRLKQSKLKVLDDYYYNNCL